MWEEHNFFGILSFIPSDDCPEMRESVLEVQGSWDWLQTVTANNKPAHIPVMVKVAKTQLFSAVLRISLFLTMVVASAAVSRAVRVLGSGSVLGVVKVSRKLLRLVTQLPAVGAIWHFCLLQ